MGLRLGGTLALDDVQVRGPRLYLVQDERGLNLTRAVAAKRAATAGGGGSGGGAFTVLLSSLRLTGGFTTLGGRFEEEMISSPETALVYGACGAAVSLGRPWRRRREMSGRHARGAGPGAPG